MVVLKLLYSLSAFVLAIVGFNALILSIIYLAHRRDKLLHPATPENNWPSVAVQLPIYNERYVIEPLIEAVSRLDYPRDRLSIQVIDDSTDETTVQAAAAIERVRQADLRIQHLRRATRRGFKAGALAYGLTQTNADYVAIFDADFVPPPDFLRRVMPYFLTDQRLGMVQARWGHINPDYSSLTRAQALALDAHFVVEQTARHRSGLLMNFAGSAGVWRRACLEDGGGWHDNTLSEDIDLSYRAQLRGWRMLYLPDLVIPAEIPPLMAGFKRQQSRWATGTVQCLRKHALSILRSHLTAWQKLQAFIHLGGYFIHPAMLIVLLLTLPLAITHEISNLPLAGLGLAMIGPPLQAIIAQRYLHSDWLRRLTYYPILMLLGIGIAVSNTEAVFLGFISRPHTFHRTPKFHAQVQDDRWADSAYALPVDHTTWAEIVLALYAALTAVFALQNEPALFPFMVLYALGLTYVAGLGLWQAHTIRHAQRRLRRTVTTGIQTWSHPESR